MKEKKLMCVMKMLELKYKKDKKGLSGIVATILMIALAVAIVGVVWVVITNLVSERLEEAGTCLEVIGKVEIDKARTCYDSGTEILEFSIVLAEIKLDELAVSIAGAGSTKSYDITNEANEDSPVTFYDESTGVLLPAENEGFVYKLNTAEVGLGVPQSIKIFPTVGGQRCGESDNLQEIRSCLF